MIEKPHGERGQSDMTLRLTINNENLGWPFLYFQPFRGPFSEQAFDSVILAGVAIAPQNSSMTRLKQYLSGGWGLRIAESKP